MYSTLNQLQIKNSFSVLLFCRQLYKPTAIATTMRFTRTSTLEAARTTIMATKVFAFVASVFLCFCCKSHNTSSLKKIYFHFNTKRKICILFLCFFLLYLFMFFFLLLLLACCCSLFVLVTLLCTEMLGRGEEKQGFFGWKLWVFVRIRNHRIIEVY